MANGQMLEELRKMAGEKDFDYQQGIRLSLSATADILETLVEIKRDVVRMDDKFKPMSIKMNSLDAKITTMNGSLNETCNIIKEVKETVLVKVSRFIDNHKRLTIVSMIIVIAFIVPEWRNTIVEWLSIENIVRIFTR